MRRFGVSLGLLEVGISLVEEIMVEYAYGRGSKSIHPRAKESTIDRIGAISQNQILSKPPIHPPTLVHASLSLGRKVD